MGRGLGAEIGSGNGGKVRQDGFYREGYQVSAFITGGDGMLTSWKRGDVVTKLERDADGLLTSLRLPSGHRFDLSYDETGKIMSLKDQTYGMLLTFVYDPRHNRPVVIQRNIDPDLIMRMELDTQGNLSKVTTREGRAESLTWTPRGQPLLLTGANGLTRHYTYDANGLLTKTREGGGAEERETTYAYDAAGVRGHPKCTTCGHLKVYHPMG